jgi:hypothetical protein
MWTDSLEQPEQWKMDMRFVTWNLRSLYRSDSLKPIARELGECRLDLAGVQIRCDSFNELADTIFCENGNAGHWFVTGVLYFRESNKHLRGRIC